jgi:hypothetical protein
MMLCIITGSFPCVLRVLVGPDGRPSCATIMLCVCVSQLRSWIAQRTWRAPVLFYVCFKYSLLGRQG